MREFFFGVVKFVSYEKGFSINSPLLWRHGGLMISEVDSWSRGLHLQPSLACAGLRVKRSAFVAQPGLCWTQGQEVWVSVNVLCSCAKHFILTVFVSTQEYKCMGSKNQSGKPDKMLGGWGGGIMGEIGLASCPGLSSNTPSCFM